MKVAGQRQIMPLLDRLDKIKEAKVQEFYESAQVRIAGAKKTVQQTAAVKLAVKPAVQQKASKPQVIYNCG